VPPCPAPDLARAWVEHKLVNDAEKAVLRASVHLPGLTVWSWPQASPGGRTNSMNGMCFDHSARRRQVDGRADPGDVRADRLIGSAVPARWSKKKHWTQAETADTLKRHALAIANTFCNGSMAPTSMVTRQRPVAELYCRSWDTAGRNAGRTVNVKQVNCRSRSDLPRLPGGIDYRGSNCIEGFDANAPRQSKTARSIRRSPRVLARNRGHQHDSGRVPAAPAGGRCMPRPSPVQRAWSTQAGVFSSLVQLARQHRTCRTIRAARRQRWARG